MDLFTYSRIIYIFSYLPAYHYLYRVMIKEQLSIFDIFKIGVGPSSSHTLGPWRAGQAFIRSLDKKGILADLSHLRVLLYGSLAKTGKGHGTDIAIQLGLAGYDPVGIDTSTIPSVVERIQKEKTLAPGLSVP